MAQNIEDFLPPIQSAGLNTNKVTQFGNVVVGAEQNVVSLSSATTLTLQQSNSTVLFNSATGFVVTLPAPTLGAQYNFIVATAASSGTHGVATNATSSVFIQGYIPTAQTTTGTVGTFFSSSTAAALRLNGTTTGGSPGTYFSAVCTSPTVWFVTGVSLGSGALATPFYVL